MHKLIFSLFIFTTFALSAQSKKAPAKKAAPQPVISKDEPKPWGESDTTTAYVDSAEIKPKEVEPQIPREFMVYTKKPKQKGERMKMCFNLVSRDTVLNYCVNDSLCKNPEVTKVLFETQKADTTYLLIFVEAFTKAGDDYPQCNAGKETKLVFVRWNTKTNKAKWKQRTVGSCIRNIQNMTKEPIVNWDQSAPLVVSYYRGGSDFPEIKFDPAHPELGIQGTIEAEVK